MSRSHGRSTALVRANDDGAAKAGPHGLLHPRTRTEIALVTALASTIAALVIAGLFYSSMYFNLFFTVSSTTDTAGMVLASKPVGRVVVPTNGITCREFTFDNDSGHIEGYRLVRCADPTQPGSPSMPPLAAGFASFKQAFGKH